MKSIAATIGQVRAELRELVSRVAYGGQRITITRNGIPAAALVSLEDLRLLDSLAVDTGQESASVDPDESVTMRASLREVWDSVTRY